VVTTASFAFWKHLHEFALAFAMMMKVMDFSATLGIRNLPDYLYSAFGYCYSRDMPTKQVGRGISLCRGEQFIAFLLKRTNHLLIL